MWQGEACAAEESALHTAHKNQDQKDYNHEPEPAARVISPRPAVGPCGQSSDKQQDQNYEKNSKHRFLLESRDHGSDDLTAKDHYFVPFILTSVTYKARH
jgi:hypothetical protein